MKILVYGNSGSGKSTYAKAMSARHGMAHLDLDSIVWEPGKIAVQRQPEEIAASLRAFIHAEPRWVIEGCYGELVEAASQHCTELVFLNPGRDACLANNLQRPWEPHKYASLDEQNSMLAQLQAWVAAYYTRDDPWSYAAHRRIFDMHAGGKVEHLSVARVAQAIVQALEAALVPHAFGRGMLREPRVGTDPIFNPKQDIPMSKGLNQKKNTKKAPAKTLDEKRAAKREKAKKA